MIRVGAFLLALCVAGTALAATPEEDVEHYLKIFQGDTGHERAVEELGWKGISDVRLYDVMERRLLADFNDVRRDREGKGRVARYIRGLAFSGQPKYEPTIGRFLYDPDYGRHAKIASEDLPHYTRWNPIISNRAAFDPKVSDDGNRVLNMLRSGDPLLEKIGAKCVYFRENEAAVVDALAELVRQRYRVSDPVNADTTAWMVKGLGRAGREKYRDLLEDVKRNAADRGPRNQAESALR